MKSIIFFLLALGSLSSMAQTKPPQVYASGSTVNNELVTRGFSRSDSGMGIPYRDTTFIPERNGYMTVRPADNLFYIYLGHWTSFATYFRKSYATNGLNQVNDSTVGIGGRQTKNDTISAANLYSFLHDSTTGFYIRGVSNTTAPDASAILQTVSTQKGVIFSKMNTTQMNAISSPTAGLMIFNTDSIDYCIYNGASWQKIPNIYTNDGSLYADRSLGGNNHILNFGTSGNPVNKLNIFSAGYIALNGITSFQSFPSISDANYVASANQGTYKLPVITANRTFTPPASLANAVIYIWDANNSAFVWSPAVGSVFKDASGATIPNFSNNNFYQFMSDGTNWIQMGSASSSQLQVGALSLLGNSTGATANAQNITLAPGLKFVSTVLTPDTTVLVNLNYFHQNHAGTKDTVVFNPYGTGIASISGTGDSLWQHLFKSTPTLGWSYASDSSMQANVLLPNNLIGVGNGNLTSFGDFGFTEVGTNRNLLIGSYQLTSFSNGFTAGVDFSAIAQVPSAIPNGSVVFVGGSVNMTGGSNTLVNGGFSITSGNNNTEIGANSGFGLKTGAFNIGVGENSGGVDTGQYNIDISAVSSTFGHTIVNNSNYTINIGTDTSSGTGHSRQFSTYIGHLIPASRFKDSTADFGTRDQLVIFGDGGGNTAKMLSFTVAQPGSIFWNTDSVAYCFYNGSFWSKFGAGGSGGGVNIYNANGSLTGNRTLTGGSDSLTLATTLFNGNNTSSFTGFNASYNNQSGTTYTLQAIDNGKVVTISNAAAITLTVPTGLPIGFTCTIIQLGVGQITYTPSSTTLNSHSASLVTSGQYAMTMITSTATNVFDIGGDLVGAGSNGASGSYTPSLTNTTNISSSSLYQATYSQNGKIVEVDISVNIIPTSSSPASTTLTVSLPVNTATTIQNYCGIVVTGQSLTTPNVTSLVSIQSASTATVQFQSSGNSGQATHIHIAYHTD